MLEKGSLVLIPFPFSDLATTKKRPVLVLHSNEVHQEIICLAVTTKSYHDNAVRLDADGMGTGTIPKASWIRTDKVFTLSQSIVLKQLGIVKPEVLLKTIESLCGVVGMDKSKS